MDSVASTAVTTPRAFTARGAEKDFTDTERETAVCPAIVTPKVDGKWQRRRERGVGRRGEWEKQAAREREVLNF